MAEPTNTEQQSGDTHRFEMPMWDIAPGRWVTPDRRGEYQVVEAQMTGEKGSEKLVVEIERVPSDE